MFDTLKKKILCISSIVAYILTIVFSHLTFGGVRPETGKISVDGAGAVILFAIISAVLYVFWILSSKSLSDMDKPSIISFAVSSIGIIGSGLSYWRFALLNEAQDVMGYHGASGWDYSSSQREMFYSLSKNIESSATTFLVVSIVLWIVSALAIFFTVSNIKKSQ